MIRIRRDDWEQLDADQWAGLVDLPENVLLGEPAETEDGWLLFDDVRLSEDESFAVEWFVEERPDPMFPPTN